MWMMKTETDGLSWNNGAGRKRVVYKAPTQEMAAERWLSGRSGSWPAQVLTVLGNIGPCVSCRS